MFNRRHDLNHLSGPTLQPRNENVLRTANLDGLSQKGQPDISTFILLNMSKNWFQGRR
jgi:hypothetical protein